MKLANIPRRGTVKMGYVLVIAASTAMFLPKSISYIPYDTMEHCQAALEVAKDRWATINSESECVDLEKSQKIRAAKEALKELEQNK